MFKFIFLTRFERTTFYAIHKIRCIAHIYQFLLAYKHQSNHLHNQSSKRNHSCMQMESSFNFAFAAVRLFRDQLSRSIGS